MAISVGDTLPSGTFRYLGPDGPEERSTEEIFKGRKVVLFGLPGAFTGTCTNAHMPSVIRNREKFSAKGVDEVICLTVNDVFAMDAWDKSMDAAASGVSMMTDPDSSFTKAIGLNFSVEAVGFVDRSKRYAMVVEDGKVALLNVNDNPGECTISSGDDVLNAL